MERDAALRDQIGELRALGALLAERRPGLS
jgi:hypothetical protein